MTDYPKLAPVVKKAYAKFEADLAKSQKAFEEKYVALSKTDKKAAAKTLNKWNLKAMADAEALTEKLTDEVFTIRTTDIQTANFFANRKKKD